MRFSFPLILWLFLVPAQYLPAAVRPNILLAISDDQSWIHASAYGYPAIKTPAFDRVAKAGVLFQNAFAASPGCSPSRAALLTGRYPWQLEQAGTHASSFPKKYHVYPELLEAAGYFVGYTDKPWGPGNWQESGRERNPAGPGFNRLKTDSPQGIRDTDYAANFEDFLNQKPADAPFSFWYGASEPHRGFKKGIGLEQGKRLEDAVVPSFLPDTPEVRSDILDYCVEIEWFDRHLGRMLDLLEERGELDNTLVVVTSDNGMAFPRAKANVCEYGIRMPLAIAWPDTIPRDRVVETLVSLTDLAPTFLEAAQVEHPGEPAMTGNSLLPLLKSNSNGWIDLGRNAVFSSRERHSSSRYNNWTYPQRAMRTRDHLFIWNLKPERWPAGAPQKFGSDGELEPMHQAYHDIDACPTLDVLVKNRNQPFIARYFHLAVDKRPEFELYRIGQDPGCLDNLAVQPEHTELFDDLRGELMEYLEETGDTRLGENPDIWEEYIRYSHIRKFPRPE